MVDEIKTKEHGAVVLSSASEKEAQERLTHLLKATPIPEEELLANVGLFLTSKNLSRILFFYEVYQKIIHTHGAVFEFGVRWGQTLSLFSALRGIFEPFNRHRRIIGFDTFGGLQGISEKDGQRFGGEEGSFSVTQGYEGVLEEILAIQERLNPISHLKKFEIIKGDAVETVPDFFRKNPEVLVSLAVFDFDLYTPTKVALEAVKGRLFKGSVLVFDELSDDIFPGETLALMETLGVGHLRIRRFPMTARVAYVVME